MNFKNLLLIVTVLFFVSCSKEDSFNKKKLNSEVENQTVHQNLNGINGQNSIYKVSKIDTSYALNVANEAMIDFVNGVKSFYTRGMSYADLKHAINPENNLSEISDVGEDLLYTAYNHIINETPPERMAGDEMMIAIAYIAEKNLKEGIVYATNENMVYGFKKHLLGLPSNYDFENYNLTTYGRDCDGFFASIWCGLEDAWNWLTSDGPDDDGDTNGEEILDAALKLVKLLRVFGVI